MNVVKGRHFRVDKYGDTIDVYLPFPGTPKLPNIFWARP